VHGIYQIDLFMTVHYKTKHPSPANGSGERVF